MTKIPPTLTVSRMRTFRLGFPICPTSELRREVAIAARSTAPAMVSVTLIENAGANRGIGHQLATRFQEKGYVVYGTYRPQTAADPTVTEVSVFLLAEGLNWLTAPFNVAVEIEGHKNPRVGFHVRRVDTGGRQELC